MSFRDFLKSKGVYIAYKVNSPELEKFQSELNTTLEGELHCTLIYSAKEFSLSNIKSLDTSSLVVSPKKFSLFGPNNDILVLEVSSEYLISYNKELTKQYGFISDWVYSPHITLGLNFTGDISKLVFESDIILDNIYMEELWLW